MLTNQYQRGVALMVAMLTIAVALPIGLAILETTTQQVRLASLARDSEIAFTAAEAAAECAQMYRVIDTAGGTRSLDCFGEDVFLNVTATYADTNPAYDVNGDGRSEIGQFSYSVTRTGGVCSEFDVYYMFGNRLEPPAIDFTFDFGGNVTHRCAIGDTCTVIVARGYNRACDSLDSSRVSQRELVLKL